MDFNEVEPHLNADAYRNLKPLNVVARQIDFIDYSQAESYVVGCSSLSGRYWTGSVFCFKSMEFAPDNAIASIRCDSGVPDGQFIGDREVIVAQDNGLIRVFDIQTKKMITKGCARVFPENNGTVASLSVFHDKTHAVLGGMDMSINVIDIKTLSSKHVYRPAHRRSVTSVSVQLQSGNSHVFASCSLDGYALMWDTRQAKPATVLMKNTAVELTAVAWHPVKQDVVAVGSAIGDVALVDVRQVSQICQIPASTRPIHRLRFAHHCSDFLAVCGNDTQVKVFDTSCSTPKIIYCDDRHTDFVRGLAWQPKSERLISGGWDKSVLSHSVPLSRNME